MWTSTWLDAEALPAQPEMVIEPSTVVRSGMVTSVGLVPVQPGGPLMVNENVVVWVLAEEVPVRVTGYVPTGVVVAVVMVSVAEPPAVTEAGLNEGAAPGGSARAGGGAGRGGTRG